MSQAEIDVIISLLRAGLALNTVGVIAVVVVGVKGVRSLARFEQRVDLMWADFESRVLRARDDDEEIH